MESVGGAAIRASRGRWLAWAPLPVSGRGRTDEGPEEDTVTASEWGRVAEDGTVYVKTADGERSVGQYPEGSPEEALAFYTKRYDELSGSVHLLEQRVTAGVVSPDEATELVRNLRAQVVD